MDLSDLTATGVRAFGKSVAERCNKIAEAMSPGQKTVIPGSELELAAADAREAQLDADIDRASA